MPTTIMSLEVYVGDVVELDASADIIVHTSRYQKMCEIITNMMDRLLEDDRIDNPFVSGDGEDGKIEIKYDLLNGISDANNVLRDILSMLLLMGERHGIEVSPARNIKFILRGWK